ncbi:MAG: hypothetical protein HW406_635, partial [Candidatus Brocadiaceae bacterium]|nr:hypothetical protein [Candidatus Brocadiaceae bacterium]
DKDTLAHVRTCALYHDGAICHKFTETTDFADYADK